MTAAIKVENLGKKYRIGHKNTAPYSTLREAIGRNALSLINRIRHPRQHRNKNAELEEFWALQDINFEIKPGERIGIIGRNGAGKSTLLKILSRITAPTTGQAVIHGRVASLLEVGTGFHPELTGRENIFLNGAILGMRKTEIKNKFDEIVAFAEVEKFLDTPVKRYSSGMYVRLAFAVAAHLEPEILIVDEVLAVGDAQFQKKCLGKMEEVSVRQGRTVLFVSHNLPAVENLCKTGMVLRNGSLQFYGRADEAISNYINMMRPTRTGVELRYREDRKGEGRARIVNIGIEKESCENTYSIKVGENLTFNISYEAVIPIQNPRLIIGVYDLMNSGIARFDTEIATGIPSVLPCKGNVICKVKNVTLCPGSYQVNIAFLGNGIMEDYLADAIGIEVLPTDFFKTGKLFTGSDANLAKVLFQHEWSALS
jgi:lipopolysaccharide transport system ATP-binding protein